MANTIVEANCGSGKGTLTLKLCALDSDSVANGAGDTASEETNRLGLYRWTVTEALAGAYHAIITDAAGLLVLSGYVYLADDTNVHRVEQSYAAMMLQEEWADGGRLDLILDIAGTSSPVNVTASSTLLMAEV